jgi:hypothetical protein
MLFEEKFSADCRTVGGTETVLPTHITGWEVHYGAGWGPFVIFILNCLPRTNGCLLFELFTVQGHSRIVDTPVGPNSKAPVTPSTPTPIVMTPTIKVLCRSVHGMGWQPAELITSGLKFSYL